MNKSIIAATVLALMTSTASVATAGAFGIEKGDQIESLEVTGEGSRGVYMVEPEKPHSLFDSYAVVFTAETGVCEVRALTETIENDGYGINVRSQYDGLVASLSKKYGKPAKNEFLRSGALWDEADEWVMAIRQNDRSHQAAWDADIDPDFVEKFGITDIFLTVRAGGSGRAWINLQYRFDNSEACQAVIKAEQDDAL